MASKIYISEDEKILVIYDEGAVNILKLVRSGEPPKAMDTVFPEIAETLRELIPKKPITIKERVNAVMETKYGRGRGRCSKCGEAGHRAPTCGIAREAAEDDSAEDIHPKDNFMPPQTFGEQVQELKSQGMTSREVAELLGASVGKVNMYWVNPEGESKPIGQGMA